jgi:hypothetical protein
MLCSCCKDAVAYHAWLLVEISKAGALTAAPPALHKQTNGKGQALAVFAQKIQACVQADCCRVRYKLPPPAGSPYLTSAAADAAVATENNRACSPANFRGLLKAKPARWGRRLRGQLFVEWISTRPYAQASVMNVMVSSTKASAIHSAHVRTRHGSKSTTSCICRLELSLQALSLRRPIPLTLLYHPRVPPAGAVWAVLVPSGTQPTCRWAKIHTTEGQQGHLVGNL